MDNQQNKVILKAYLTKLEKAVLREVSVRKELENDKATKIYLESKKSAGEEFNNPIYEDYDSWIETINKQIKKSENALDNIFLKKAEIEALKSYLTE